MAYYLLFSAIVLVDQWFKTWIMESVPLGGRIEFFPGVLSLTYVQNTGAAFSMLRDNNWILMILVPICILLLFWALTSGVVKHSMGKIALCLLLAGAAGNYIDRVFYGFVVDMFHVEFMDFAIFNIADCAITTGSALLLLYIVFQFPKEGAKAGHKKAPEKELEDKPDVPA